MEDSKRFENDEDLYGGDTEPHHVHEDEDLPPMDEEKQEEPEEEVPTQEESMTQSDPMHEETSLPCTTSFFAGSVIEAVTAAKASSKLLLVLIEGDNDESKLLLETTFSSQEVADACSQLIALRITDPSENSTNFKQFFPVSSIPCIYIISPSGSPLEILTGFVDADTLLEKMNASKSAFEEQQKKLMQQLIMMQLAQAAQAQQSPAASPPAMSSAVGGGAPSRPLTEQEKQHRAQELVQKAKEKRTEQESRSEREGELKRRKDGQEAARLQKEISEKREKEAREKAQSKAQLEKLKEKQDRERVLEQIRRDKEERRIQAEKKKMEAAGGSPPQPVSSTPLSNTAAQPRPVTAPAAPSPAVQQPASTAAALAIRQMDGQVLKNTFSSSTTLATVKTYIDQNRTDGSTRYNIVMPYPRTVFGPAHMSMTLLELQLAPSGTLVLSPIEGPGSVPQTVQGQTQEGGSGFLSSVKSALSYLNPFAWGSTQPAQTQAPPSAPASSRAPARPTPGQPRIHGLSSSPDSTADQGPASANPYAPRQGANGWYEPNPELERAVRNQHGGPAGGSSTPRASNVRTLGGGSGSAEPTDKDKRESYYNGNSTSFQG